MTTKQFLIAKLNEKFVGTGTLYFSDEFILEILSEIEVDDLIEIMEDYVTFKIDQEMIV